MAFAVDYTLRDWIALILIESASAVAIVAIIFRAPLGDWFMRRRMRKKAEYAWKLRQMHKRKYDTVGKSRWHGKN